MTCPPKIGPCEMWGPPNMVRRTACVEGSTRKSRDHRGAEGSRGGQDGQGDLPGARHHRSYLLSVESGLEVSEARRLKQLEDENRRLKHLVSDLTLDNHALKGAPRQLFLPIATIIFAGRCQVNWSIPSDDIEGGRSDAEIWHTPV